MVASLAAISAGALVPDQLLAYVAAVSGLKSRRLGDCLLHYGSGEGVLVAYPVADPLDAEAIENAVALALELPDLEHLSVLAPLRPKGAPADCRAKSDSWWFLPLPAPTMPLKVRNMLKRASRDVHVEKASGNNAWTAAHATLVEDFCHRKGSALGEGDKFLFSQLGSYLSAVSGSILFSAITGDGALAACAIGDFSALATAFYMFAFRAESAPPGAADLLLNAIIAEGIERGHSRLNLGLGIDPGVSFFKKKWGASADLPYVETSWSIKKKRKGFFARLFGGGAE